MVATYQLPLFDAAQFNQSEPIEERFKAALECLDSIPYINHGGCGISALAIYRWCKKNGVEVGDRPFVFLWGENDGWEIHRNDNLLRNGMVEDVEAPDHIAVELDGELYDSEGTDSSLFEYCNCPQEYQLNEEELLTVINNIDEWNHTFRRSNVRKIEFGLGIDLSDVRLK